MYSEAIEQYFEEYAKRMYESYKVRKEEYYKLGYTEWKNKYSVAKGTITKGDFLLISQTHLDPIPNCGKSIKEIIDYDIELKKKKLYKQIESKVGNVISIDLYTGIDGSINGIVQGDLKTVTITTVMAGGYNVQCLHYRILIK